MFDRFRSTHNLIRIEEILSFDQDTLDILCMIYGSSREAELKQTNWSTEQKQAFILHQFRAQHEYYQKIYPHAYYALIKLVSTDVGRLYLNESQMDVRIIDITLLPPYRNQKLGTSILTDLKNYCAKKRLSLSIHVENFNPAKRLYQRLGFEYAQSYDQVYDLMMWQGAVGTSAEIMNNNERLASLHIDHFTNWRQADWMIIFDTKLPPIKVTLEEIRLHTHRDHAPRQGFSLIFTSEQTGLFYKQDIYILLHPSLGELHLFIVPLGPNELRQKMQYEIVIA